MATTIRNLLVNFHYKINVYAHVYVSINTFIYIFPPKGLPYICIPTFCFSP